MPVKERPLFFHGTSTLSVWRSYRHALTLNAMAKKAPARLKGYLQLTKGEEIFARFGPIYPEMLHNSNCMQRWGLPSLTTNFRMAHGFALNYERRINIWLTLNGDGYLGKYFNDTRKLIGKLSLSKDGPAIPGAILVVDHNYMFKHQLLLDAHAEEDAHASALPWRAIRGIVFTGGTEGRCKFTGLHQRDPNIAEELFNNANILFELTRKTYGKNFDPSFFDSLFSAIRPHLHR